MRFFGKKQPDEVPGWAMNMSPEDFERFLKEVERSVRKHGVAPIIHREEGFFTPKDKSGHQMGLHNLVQMCAPHTPLEWPEIIDEHMRIIFSMNAEKLPMDWEIVKDKIKLRLLPLDTRIGYELIEFPISPAFITCIAVDHPKSIALIKAAELDEWPIAKSQLYDLALQNMWEQDMPDTRVLVTEEGTTLYEFRSPSFFTSSHVLMLDRHLHRGFPSFPMTRGFHDIGSEELRVPIQAPNGALVIIPTRDNAFFHVIENLKVAHEVSRLIEITRKFYADGPGPVTPCLLWWRDGKFIDLPWEPVGEKVDFYPPPEFVEVLNSLSP